MKNGFTMRRITVELKTSYCVQTQKNEVIHHLQEEDVVAEVTEDEAEDGTTHNNGQQIKTIKRSQKTRRIDQR